MTTILGKRSGLAALALAGALALTACGSGDSTNSGSGSSSSSSAAESTTAAATTVTVTDAQGEVEVPVPAERIAATDNRIFRTLEAWSVPLVVAPVDLMPDDLSYASDSAILNTGTHNEPDLEQFVAGDPDLVLNGQRYSSYYEDIKELVPDAAVVDTNIDVETKPLDEELRRSITLLGEVLAKPDEAAALIAEFDASIEAAKAAYDPGQTVMGLLTSGGDIAYVAPSTGRAIGPVFDVLGLTPALEQEASDTSHGDDISVEAIAQSNPDWIFVMDRDAAVGPEEGQEYVSAEELIAESEALADVTAVKEGNIIYLPANFYLTEDIQAYTEFFTSITEAMQG